LEIHPEAQKLSKGQYQAQLLEEWKSEAQQAESAGMRLTQREFAKSYAEYEFWKEHDGRYPTLRQRESAEYKNSIRRIENGLSTAKQMAKISRARRKTTL
jgi:hypothetical protein